MAKKRYVRPDKEKKAETVTEETKPKRRGRPPRVKEPIPFVSGIPEGDVVEILLEEIDFNDTELEFRVDQKLKDLLEDITKNGQQFPVVLRKLAKNDLYQIVSGFRRCRTLKALEWPTVKAIVRTDLDDDQAFRVSYMENDKRKNLTGVDKANAIAKLRLRGKSDTDIQEIYNIGQRQVERYKQVSTFPRAMKDSISGGGIKTTHGLALMKIINAHGEDKVKSKDWIARIEHEDLSIRKLTRELNATFGKVKKKKRYLEKQDSGGFRLYPMKFDPKSTPASAKKTMLAKLKIAVALLEETD